MKIIFLLIITLFVSCSLKLADGIDIINPYSELGIKISTLDDYVITGKNNSTELIISIAYILNGVDHRIINKAIAPHEKIILASTDKWYGYSILEITNIKFY